MGDQESTEPGEGRASRTHLPRRIVLTRSECLAHLGRARLGRLVLSIECLPAARPVLLALVDRSVVAAINPGPEADAIDRGDVVALEIDGETASERGTWWVRVTGTAGRLHVNTAWATRLARTSLAPLMSMETSLLQLSTDLIDGERRSYTLHDHS